MPGSADRPAAPAAPVAGQTEPASIVLQVRPSRPESAAPGGFPPSRLTAPTAFAALAFLLALLGAALALLGTSAVSRRFISVANTGLIAHSPAYAAAAGLSLLVAAGLLFLLGTAPAS